MSKALTRALLEQYDKSLNLSDVLNQDAAMGSLQLEWKTIARIRGTNVTQIIFAVPPAPVKMLRFLGISINNLATQGIYMRVSMDGGATFQTTGYYDQSYLYLSGTPSYTFTVANTTVVTEICLSLGSSTNVLSGITEGLVYLPVAGAGSRLIVRASDTNHDVNGHRFFQTHTYSAGGRPTHIMIFTPNAWHPETDFIFEAGI